MKRSLQVGHIFVQPQQDNTADHVMSNYHDFRSVLNLYWIKYNKNIYAILNIRTIIFEFTVSIHSLICNSRT